MGQSMAFFLDEPLPAPYCCIDVGAVSKWREDFLSLGSASVIKHKYWYDSGKSETGYSPEVAFITLIDWLDW